MNKPVNAKKEQGNNFLEVPPGLLAASIRLVCPLSEMLTLLESTAQYGDLSAPASVIG